MQYSMLIFSTNSLHYSCEECFFLNSSFLTENYLSIFVCGEIIINFEDNYSFLAIILTLSIEIESCFENQLIIIYSFLKILIVQNI